jgi:hypothetical protein
MAQLRPSEDKENWKQFILPSSKDKTGNDQAYVIMDAGPLVTADTLDITPDSSLMKTTALMLTRRIQEWNFEDASGPLPITYDNVIRMEIEDIQFLSRQIDDTNRNLTDEQKKTLTSTSPEQPEVKTTTIPVTQSQ